MVITYQTNVPAGREIEQKVRIGNLTAGQISNEQGVLNDAVILEYLEFATNSKDKVRLLIGNSSYTFVGGISINGSTTATSITPKNIVDNTLGLFEVLQYNENTNLYKFRLKNPIVFAKGLSLKMENTGTETQTAGLMALIRKL